MFTVITENDVSQWQDQTGVVYHFPRTYIKYLQPGTQALYYKGKMLDKGFKDKRLSTEPHYFGIATIGRSYPDTKSNKGDLFVVVENYQPFVKAISTKLDNEYLEEIPESKKSNYWRNGTRAITEETYNKIIALAEFSGNQAIASYSESPSIFNDITQSFESRVEGNKKFIYTTIYERDQKLRTQAILIHGDSCKACGFNFGKVYGDYGEGYIHVHHIKPISTAGGPISVNPETDLITLCANCHAIIHRNKNSLLSLETLKVLIANGSP